MLIIEEEDDKKKYRWEGNFVEFKKYCKDRGLGEKWEEVNNGQKLRTIKEGSSISLILYTRSGKIVLGGNLPAQKCGFKLLTNEKPTGTKQKQEGKVKEKSDQVDTNGTEQPSSSSMNEEGTSTKTGKENKGGNMCAV